MRRPSPPPAPHLKTFPLLQKVGGTRLSVCLILMLSCCVRIITKTGKGKGFGDEGVAGVVEEEEAEHWLIRSCSILINVNIYLRNSKRLRTN
jgi:hypothetical protein